MYILSPLFEIFYFFVFFKFLTSLKKNKRMLRYKVWTSVARKQTSSKHMEHIDAQCKETCSGWGQSRKFLHGSGCQISKAKMLKRLHLRNSLKVHQQQYGSDMIPETQVVRCNAIMDWHKEIWKLLQCKFLRSQKMYVWLFFTFRESKKQVNIKIQSDIFLSLVSRARKIIK